MELFLKRSVSATIVFPMLLSATPEVFESGLTPTIEPWSSDTQGAVFVSASTSGATEIGSTGLYQFTLSDVYMNTYQVALKATATNCADTGIVIRTYYSDLDDLSGQAGAALSAYGTSGVAEEASVQAIPILATDQSAVSAACDLSLDAYGGGGGVSGSSYDAAVSAIKHYSKL